MEAPPASRLRRVVLVAVRFLLFADMVRSFFDVVVDTGLKLSFVLISRAI
jgi:hypothetical protein